MKRNIHNMTDIKIIGIGNGGISILDQIIKSGLSGIEYIAIDFHWQDFKKSQAPEKIHLESSWRGFDGPGKDYIQKDTFIQKSKIRRAVSSADAVILLAGLGGETGGGATPVIIDIAKEQGIFTAAVVNTPFEFEGVHRKEEAEDAIMAVCTRADVAVVVSAEIILRNATKNTSVDDAFDLLNEMMAQAAINILGFIKSKG